MKFYFAGVSMLFSLGRRNPKFLREWLERTEMCVLDTFALPKGDIDKKIKEIMTNESKSEGITDDTSDIETGIDEQTGDDQY